MEFKYYVKKTELRNQIKEAKEYITKLENTIKFLEDSNAKLRTEHLSQGDIRIIKKTNRELLKKYAEEIGVLK